MNTVNRELSWLSFNERVLQEAMDPNVPLIERIRFLGIYSNNMDEFYRVRVAYVRRKMLLGKVKIKGFKGSAEDLYKAIRKEVIKQQGIFEKTYAEILELLRSERIHVVNEAEFSPEDQDYLKDMFNRNVRHEVFPILIDSKRPFPTLRDDAIYLAVSLTDQQDKKRFALIQLPFKQPRFFRLDKEDHSLVILLDDLIRLNLSSIFSVFEPKIINAYTFKFTRDAELDIDDDLSVNFMQKIKKSVQLRKVGDPLRLVYDSTMPKDLLKIVTHALGMSSGLNTIPGGRYHNFKDFMSFPFGDRKDLQYVPQPPNFHPLLKDQKRLLPAIERKDILLHFPYQRFEHIVDILREAALDPKVRAIRINIYRLAKNSNVVNALISAAYNGKEVTVVLELQARFDEENNLHWADLLKESGVRVILGVPHLKVHSKLMQIERMDKGKEKLYTYVGTGNFNENTSRIYSDLAILTCHPQISAEVKKVFKLFEHNLDRPMFRHLLVSPFNNRRKILAHIDAEIKHVKKGKKGLIRIKINNLTDQQLIQKLYAASAAGVKVEMIIRGICCLIPRKKGLSDNIEVISIVDRYLEHARFLVFHNDGDPVHLITSADFMERNMDSRIEVGMVVNDTDIKEELDRIFDYQWKGSLKARTISGDLKNTFKRRDLPHFHAQYELYQHYHAQQSLKEPKESESI
jgi:polyphosphate kinase